MCDYLKLHRSNGYENYCNGVNGYDNDSLESIVIIIFIAILHVFSLLHLLPTQAIIANGTGSHANTVLCIVMPIQ